MEPTAGINAGVSLFFIFPVSQHDVVSAKANLAGSIDGYNTTVLIHDFRLEKAEIETLNNVYSKYELKCFMFDPC